MAPAYADKALELRPVWYRSKAKADNPDWSWYGFIAEEVAAVDPRLVHWGYGDDDWEEVGVYDTADSETEPQLVRLERRLKQGAELKPQGVMYERLVPHLVTVIKRQQQALVALTARVEALERG